MSGWIETAAQRVQGCKLGHAKDQKLGQAKDRLTPAWPFERGRRAVRARPRGSRGITACARAKRRVEGGLGGCQAFLGRLHLAVDDRAQVIVLVTIIVTVIVIVVGLRRRARFAGACKIKPARVQSASCTRSLATPRPALLVWMWTTVGLESLTCGARPSTRAPWDWGHARGSPDPMEQKTRMLIVLSRDRVDVAR